MSNPIKKLRLLIFIVAYNAEKTIAQVLSRIPTSICEIYEVEVLIIDDASTDATFTKSNQFKLSHSYPFPITIFKNPVNQGYGGNQKVGYHYAIQFKFDYVALIHGDGQYAPECLTELMHLFSIKGVDAVFGSRMIKSGNALRGGMPLYKYIGNRILSWFENAMLDTDFSEFHSGYRIYSVSTLKQIPFDLNTNDFHFDTEIIVQFVARGLKILECPIPTYYGDEICHVNGIKYAKDVVYTVVKYKAQKLGIFYDRRFDLGSSRTESNAHYELKLDGISPHTVTLATIEKGSRVVDLGCGPGYIGSALQKKSCFITGVDQFTHIHQTALNEFVQHNLSEGPPVNIDYRNIDYILLLDVIEHLQSPEIFVEQLHKLLDNSPAAKLLVSTGNIGFIIIRFMLLIGQFNYGKRGILDITHTRLFTFSSLRRLFNQANFEVIAEQGIPAPFGLALKNKTIGKFLNWVNLKLIIISPSLFSYQMYFTVIPKKSLSTLLKNAVTNSEDLLLN